VKSALIVFIAAFSVAAQQAGKSIRVDQAGYLTGAPKVALSTAAGADSFELRRVSDNRPVFSAKESEPRQDELSGESLRLLDFSAFDKSGRYYIQTPGGERSHPFEIGSGVYRRAWYLATRSFYAQRCGTAVDLGKEFPGYRYAECHKNGAWHASSGKSGEAPSKAGWHDAGDYGRYIVNSGITTGTLLWAYEMFPSAVGKIRLDIPESANKTPDLLDEIRWNLEWMLTMQDTGGGVWHKQTTERFSGFVMPDKDPAPSVVIGTGSEPFKSSCATADFAAVMAIASRVYQPFDSEFAVRTGKAAVAAWSWADANPAVLYRNPQGVNTGAYGDRDCSDERLWASAELWRTTGEAKFHDAFLAAYAKILPAIGDSNPPSWPNVGTLGLWSYAMETRRTADRDARDAIVNASLKAADSIAERTLSHPHRVSMLPANFVWGSNSVVMNYGLQLLTANRIRPNARYVHAAAENLHYVLGRNPFSVSWVTWVGTDWFKNPHHRPSGADSNTEPWPGFLSGGPNRSKQDAAMRKLPDGLPPMKMWVDDQDSYASNENAINWNAALVFVLSGLLR